MKKTKVVVSVESAVGVAVLLSSLFQSRIAFADDRSYGAAAVGPLSGSGSGIIASAGFIDIQVPLFDAGLGTLNSLSWFRLGGISAAFDVVAPTGQGTVGIVTTVRNSVGDDDYDIFNSSDFGVLTTDEHIIIDAQGIESPNNVTDAFNLSNGWTISSSHSVHHFEVTAALTASSSASASGEFAGGAIFDFNFTPTVTGTTSSYQVGVNVPNVTTTESVTSNRVFGTLTIGSCTDSSSIGVVNLMTGGTISVTTLDVGRYGTLNQLAGVLSVSGTATIGSCGTGGTYNLTGGISTINNLAINNAGVFNMSGGTLSTTTSILIKPGGTLNQYGSPLLGSGTVTNNGTLAFLPTGTFTLSNTIVGGGTLSHMGAGTTTLTAYNGTGSILVNAGRLAFSETGATRQTSAVLVEASSLTVSTTLNMANRDLIIHSGSEAAFEAKVSSAYDYGLWDLAGITRNHCRQCRRFDYPWHHEWR